jgi:hypothetical protein
MLRRVPLTPERLKGGVGEIAGGVREAGRAANAAFLCFQLV